MSQNQTCTACRSTIREGQIHNCGKSIAATVSGEVQRTDVEPFQPKLCKDCERAPVVDLPRRSRCQHCADRRKGQKNRAKPKKIAHLQKTFKEAHEALEAAEALLVQKVSQ